MDQSITSVLSLPDCEYTEEGITQEVWRDGWMMEVHHLRMKTCGWQTCPGCGHMVHRHMTRKVRLAHFSVAPILFVVEVEYIVGRCPGCRRTTRQEIAFKAEGCMCTRFFRNSILYYCSKGGMTIKAIASLLGVNRNLVKAIDRRRLEDAYGEMKPEGVHRYIGINEFSLHRNHVYATVVIDCETGEVLCRAFHCKGRRSVHEERQGRRHGHECTVLQGFQEAVSEGGHSLRRVPYHQELQ